MRVQCLDLCEMKLPSGAVREHPEGWVGEVADDVGAGWVSEKKAKRIASKVALSDEQTSVLAAAADKALEASAQVSDLTVEPDLEVLSVSELRAMAIGRNVSGSGSMKRAQLIAALSVAPPQAD